jgi:hypothetical protein
MVTIRKHHDPERHDPVDELLPAVFCETGPDDLEAQARPQFTPCGDQGVDVVR